MCDVAKLVCVDGFQLPELVNKAHAPELAGSNYASASNWSANAKYKCRNVTAF